MVAFEVGKEYTHGWIGDSDLFTTWVVLKRTAKTVTLQHGNEIKNCRIIAKLSEWEGAEVVLPFGNYSMCPVLRANSKY